MKKFQITYNGKTEEIHTDSAKDVKLILKRRENKQRLIGLKITQIDNSNHRLPRPPASRSQQVHCYKCGEDRPEELTIDDSPTAKVICERCLREER